MFLSNIQLIYAEFPILFLRYERRRLLYSICNRVNRLDVCDVL